MSDAPPEFTEQLRGINDTFSQRDRGVRYAYAFCGPSCFPSHALIASPVVRPTLSAAAGALRILADAFNVTGCLAAHSARIGDIIQVGMCRFP